MQVKCFVCKAKIDILPEDEEYLFNPEKFCLVVCGECAQQVDKCIEVYKQMISRRIRAACLN